MLMGTEADRSNSVGAEAVVVVPEGRPSPVELLRTWPVWEQSVDKEVTKIYFFIFLLFIIIYLFMGAVCW